MATSGSRKAKSKNSVPDTVPGRNGGRLLAGGKPGNKGGGRPPDAFKAMCQALASSGAVEVAVRKVLMDPSHPAFVGALKWASEHGYGRPTQPLEHSGTVSLEELVTQSRGS